MHSSYCNEQWCGNDQSCGTLSDKSSECLVKFEAVHTHTQIITMYPIEDDDDHYIAKLDDDSCGAEINWYLLMLYFLSLCVWLQL